MKLTLREIITNIIEESEVSPEFYSDAVLTKDINREYSRLYDIVSKQGKAYTPKTQEITVNDTANLYNLDFNRQIAKVEVKVNDNWFACLSKEDDCNEECPTFKTNITWIQRGSKIELHNLSSTDDVIRVTYLGGEFIKLNADTDVPELLFEDFHDLLWLKSVLKLTYFYKPDRYKFFEAEYQEMYSSFLSEYQETNEGQTVSFKNNFKY